ncbi:MAG: hypothetical protein K2M56_00845 [Muribaculaceae bacterium]|nr:hypothetical protein [Muribaculaceae bacterium]
MKKYVIAQHPIKLTVELDDEWMHTVGIEDSDMDGMINEWEGTIKDVSMALYNIKMQKEASEAMKGDDNERD